MTGHSRNMPAPWDQSPVQEKRRKGRKEKGREEGREEDKRKGRH